MRAAGHLYEAGRPHYSSSGEGWSKSLAPGQGCGRVDYKRRRHRGISQSSGGVGHGRHIVHAVGLRDEIGGHGGILSKKLLSDGRIRIG